MKSTEVENMIGRISDMRDFFKIGDEIIPFLGDLFLFLKDVMPLMNEMNLSIQDSTGKLPTATDKIDEATQTAEMATQDIMDKLDHISESLMKLTETSNEEQKEIIESSNADVFAILNALQFQDITAQQLEHANRILAAINEKFTTLFTAIEKLKLGSTIGGRVMDAIELTKDKAEREKEVEDFEDKTKDLMRHKKISQDDIDQLFG